ncbi:MAG TPA: MFS transporter [Actinomycetota bacterium]
MASAASTARAYREVLGSGSLRRAMAAFLAFNAQEYAIWIAVTLYAYDRGGPTTAGIVAIVQLVPAAVVAPVGSVLGDRMRRDRALALGYLVQAGAAGALAFALWTAPPLLVYGAAVLSSCTITLTRPVHYAVLPELSETPEQLTASNSVSSTVEGVGIFLGPVMNSVLIALEGPGAVCAAFALLMVLAGVATARLRLLGVTEDAGEVEVEGLLEGAAAGMRELRGDPAAAVLTTLGGAQFFLLGMLDIFYAMLAIDVLGIGEEGAGVLAAAVGVGWLVGAAGTAILVGRRRLVTPIELAIGATGGATAAIALVGTVGPVLALLAVAGAAQSFFAVAARTLLQRSVRDELLARVFGLQEGLMMLGLAGGAAAAPVLVGLFGRAGAFVAAGALFVVVGAVGFPSLLALDRRSVVPDAARLDLVRSIAMFEALPQHQLEPLVLALAPIRAGDGDVIIREEDVGDRFYLVADGEAVVSHGGRDLARLGPGDHFGEIALLRDVPRTATVRAAGDVELLALHRTEFLAAVRGSRAGAEAADAEVERRLAGLGPRS